MTAENDNETDSSAKNGVEENAAGESTENKSDEDVLRESLHALAASLSANSSKRQSAAAAAVARTLNRSLDVPDPVFRGLCRVLVGTLQTKPLQPPSLKELQSMLRVMDQKRHPLVLKHLTDAINQIVKLAPNVTPSVAKPYISLLHFYSELLKTPLEPEDGAAQLKGTVEALGTLGYYALSKESKALPAIAKKTVPAWLERSDRLGVDAAIAAMSESAPEKALAAAAILTACQGGAAPVAPSTALVTLYAKAVLMAKTLPPLHLIKACSSFLRGLTSQQFNSEVLPTLKKALLRSPEVALYGASTLFDSISFPVDSFLADVLKPILACSTSADESVREVALRTASSLAGHASSSDAFKTVVNGIYAQIGNAKSPEQKTRVLASLRYSAPSAKTAEEHAAAIDTVLADVVGKLAKSTSEVNEIVVRANWETAAHLAKRITHLNDISAVFKDATKLSGAHRAGAYRMLSWLATERKLSGLPADAAKALLAEAENAQKDPLEAISLSLLLLSTAPNPSTDFSKIFELAANNDVICKEKSLSAIRDDDALLWARLLRVLLEHQQKTEATASAPPLLLRSLAILLTWRGRRDVRAEAAKGLRELLESSPEALKRVAVPLARELFQAVECGFLDQAAKRIASSSSSAASDDTLKTVTLPGHRLAEVICILLGQSPDDQSGSTKLLPDEVDELALATLPLCSLPRIVEEDGSIWLRWLHHLPATAKATLSSNQTVARFVEMVFSCKDSAVRNDALTMLSSLALAPLSAALWKHVETKVVELDAGVYETITEREVSVWRCPEGTLFNTDVVDIDEAADAKNMKRENKAYKFKDQLAEVELMRELAEKRRKEGKLTPKQKAAMEKELEKEKVIRSRVAELHAAAASTLDELTAMVEADGSGALNRPSLLVSHSIPLLQSHLVAKEAAAVFVAYVHAAFSDPEDPLRNLVAYAVLRVLRSKWTSPRWNEEPAEAQLKRLLGLLVERVFVVETGEDTEEEVAQLYEDALGAPQLAVLQPLIKALLRGQQHSDGLKQQVLDLLKNAINRRLLLEDAVLSLPLAELTELLLSFASEATLSSHISDSIEALQRLIGLVNQTAQVNGPVEETVLQVLEFVKHDRADLRESALKVLGAPALLSRVAAMVPLDSPTRTTLRCRLLVARFDPTEAVSTRAGELWLESRFSIKNDLFDAIIDEIVSPQEFVRDAAANALVLYTEELPEEILRAIQRLKEVYAELVELKGVEIDQVGRLKRDAVDEWEKRLGVVRAARLIADVIHEQHALPFIHLVVPEGLNDRHVSCRETMTSVGVAVIARHGAAHLEQLLPILEDKLRALQDGQAFDNLRQGLVVLLGTLAQYITDREKVRAIVARLVEALSTPSQKVQEAVSACLAPLVGAVDNAHQLLATMQKVLFEGASYGQRRGAAYGIAGLVKGLGMTALRENNLIQNVEKALLEKSPQKKQGSLLALEMLASTVGKLFEPYLLQCLPGLLLCFGDSDESVRKAAEDTSRAAMRSLTAHGVKCILPKVLDALDNDSWRTKCAAVDLLGAMAFCAPRQLSSCLPMIVPKLIEVLADSHTKVRASGERALKNIGLVIRNPEILGVSAQIMSGLVDPASKTSFALSTIVNTKFIHYIDAASLALIMPIVRRAFEDRNSETRRIAAQIISNIYKLAENKDMEPYLADLVPGLQRALMDPVPEIRTVAAKALGSVVSRSTGETSAKLRTSIIPWLKDKLISETSTVDRSGAAQGLAEVLSGVGTEQLDYVMPEIIQATESVEVSPETRDGYILMYIYLPMVFGDRFQPYLPRVIPSILKALADENEYVRASALKAGQRLIAQFVSQARRLLLPQLQLALADSNWRIRLAGVTLIGDFLFNISGITGKSTSSTSNEDDTMGMEQAGKTIVRALGQKCRDDVLAGLYLSRSDVALTVRQGASHVWKMVVSNTPRTLKEIMKTLFEKVLESLASICEESQQTAARCLGELVRKMGEKIITEVLPVLEEYQKSEDIEKRVGVAIALHEIIDNMSKDVLQHYLSQIVLPLRTALADEEEAVRESAASTFTVFHASVGIDAYDEVIEPLLEQLTDERTPLLEGLAAVMEENSKHMLPYILPRLTRKPVKVVALCTLAAHSGDSLSRQLSRVLDSLLSACERNDQYDPMIEPCEEVVLSVADEEGAEQLLSYLLKKADQGVVPAAVLLHTFLEKTALDLEEHTTAVLQGCLQLYSTTHQQIADHAVLALLAHMQKIDAGLQLANIPLAKKTISNMAFTSKGKQLLGFTHPKSLNALVAMFREGVLQGSVETKAISAEALGVVVSLSTPEAIKPHVINMTGPLIRVLGDRFPPTVKQSILSCLSQLLDKVSLLLRAFVPQLQSTFLKALQEPSSRPVRLSSAGALARLVKLSPKPEPILSDMLKTIAAAQDKALTETTLVAARAVVANALPNSLTAAVLAEAAKASQACLATVGGESDLDESIVAAAGALAGQAAMREGSEAIKKLLTEAATGSGRVRAWAACGVQQMCAAGAAEVLEMFDENLRTTITAALQGDASVASAAVRACAHVLIYESSSPSPSLLASVGRAINHQSLDVRRAVGVALANVFCRLQQPLPIETLKNVIPQLVNGTKESNSAVRSAAELALVYTFRLHDKGEAEQEKTYNAYLAGCEGAAKKVLEEVHRSLTRIVRNGDLAIDAFENILSAP